MAGYACPPCLRLKSPVPLTLINVVKTLASEKAPKHPSEKAVDNALEKAPEIASDQNLTQEELILIEDDGLSVHDLIDLAEPDLEGHEEHEDLLAVINESLSPFDKLGPLFLSV